MVRAFRYALQEPVQVTQPEVEQAESDLKVAGEDNNLWKSVDELVTEMQGSFLRYHAIMKAIHDTKPDIMCTFDILVEYLERKSDGMCWNRLVAIALTLSPSTAGLERNFSRMKLVKTRLRTSMQNFCLNWILTVRINTCTLPDIDGDVVPFEWDEFFQFWKDISSNLDGEGHVDPQYASNYNDLYTSFVIGPKTEVFSYGKAKYAFKKKYVKKYESVMSVKKRKRSGSFGGKACY